MQAPHDTVSQRQSERVQREAKDQRPPREPPPTCASGRSRIWAFRLPPDRVYALSIPVHRLFRIVPPGQSNQQWRRCRAAQAPEERMEPEAPGAEMTSQQPDTGAPEAAPTAPELAAPSPAAADARGRRGAAGHPPAVPALAGRPDHRLDRPDGPHPDHRLPDPHRLGRQRGRRQGPRRAPRTTSRPDPARSSRWAASPRSWSTRTQGVKAYSAICTHLGCVVAWNDLSSQIVCPCHGGQFNPATGAVVGGPPPTPLPPINVSVEGNQIFLTEA